MWGVVFLSLTTALSKVECHGSQQSLLWWYLTLRSRIWTSLGWMLWSVYSACWFAVVCAAWTMLGSARALRALAFSHVGECTAMAAHSVNDPLDPIYRWSVLGRLKCLTQWSYWPICWGLAERENFGWGGPQMRPLPKEGPQTSVVSPVTVQVWSCY